MDMPYLPTELADRRYRLDSAWRHYMAAPQFDPFVEFVVTLSSLTEFLVAKQISGVMQLAEALEQYALELFNVDHPMAPESLMGLSDKIHVLDHLVLQHIERQELTQERRKQQVETQKSEWMGFRSVWLLSSAPERWQEMLQQLGYFGLTAAAHDWEKRPAFTDEMPMLLIDATDAEMPRWAERVRQLRHSFPTCRIVAFAMKSNFQLLQVSLEEGCDFCLLEETPVHQIVSQLLTLSEASEDEPYKVLIVEDSKTATKLTQQALNEHQIITRAIAAPQQVLGELATFQPDLILMDMHMPGCTGVDAARVIRQHQQYLSIPIVYLSSETDVGLQIEALRLGGDFFLTKPFNPVFLNAIVKSTVERYRALRWSMFRDSLTGLHNHTSTKVAIESALALARQNNQPMSVVMIDIDHFKQVNDRYGHPTGDQVIRSLAWLLRRRLRKTDIIGRYGGEEFLLGLPGVTAVQAQQILDRIRLDFSCLRHPDEGGHFFATFSGGVVDSGVEDHAEGLINAADSALYQAKHAGRNCLKVFLASSMS